MEEKNMITYTVHFEFREAAATEFRQHRGDFKAANPLHARNCVVGQLQALGLVVGVFAVYEGEWLVLGAVLPKPFTPVSAPHLYAVSAAQVSAHV
jgi:hypothetical protein